MPKNKNLTFRKFLWPIIKPYKWWYVLMLQAPLISSFYKVTSIFSLKLLVDAFTQKSMPTYSELVLPISLFVGAILVMEAGWRISHYAWMKTQPYVRAKIVSQSYDYIQNHSFAFFQNSYSGSIVSKVKGILAGYNNLWFGIHHRLAIPITEIIVMVCAMAFINLNIFIFIAIWCLIFFPILLKMCVNIGHAAKEATDSQHKAMGFISDNITNIFSLFSFASRKRELSKIEKFLHEDTAKKDVSWIKKELIMSLVGIFFYATMLISLLFFIIFLRRSELISTGDIVFIMTLSFFMVDNLWSLINEAGDFLGKMGDFKSSFAILQIPHDALDKINAKKINIKHGAIEFKKIDFGYNNENIFKDLDLNIKAGEKIGLVGHSGAGKSTLISLLLKNFKAKSGEILIDGQNIYDVKSDSLRQQISIIPQDMMLFHRSIGDNIGYAKVKATKKEIISAAKKAHIHEFIETLDDGYETLVGERGIKLSGGQRQRIAIARAILKDAPILILDEATSSLDSKTEKLIQESLDNIMGDKSKTVIAIAHRLSTLKTMDRIIVVDEGRVIEQGSHDELIVDSSSFYKKLWDLQEI